MHVDQFLQLRGYMRKAGGRLALFAGLYGVVAAIITLIVLGGLGSSASVDPKGVLLGWVGLGLSLMISILGAATIRTSSQGPVFLLLLCALTGAVISETLVSLLYGRGVLQRVAGDRWMRFDTFAFLRQANYQNKNTH